MKEENFTTKEMLIKIFQSIEKIEAQMAQQRTQLEQQNLHLSELNGKVNRNVTDIEHARLKAEEVSLVVNGLRVSEGKVYLIASILAAAATIITTIIATKLLS